MILLNSALDALGLPYAFGGAIALNYHREPRATVDIDINIFVRPASGTTVLAVLGQLYDVTDGDRAREELSRDGQTRTRWGTTFVDLFLANTDFHDAMAGRVERQPFGDVEIPVLAIEDLIVCKVLFDRPKDWVDVQAVVAAERVDLDSRYIGGWLEWFLPPDDERLIRWDQVLRSAPG